MNEDHENHPHYIHDWLSVHLSYIAIVKQEEPKARSLFNDMLKEDMFILCAQFGNEKWNHRISKGNCAFHCDWWFYHQWPFDTCIK